MKITSMSHRTIELNCSKYFNLIVALACVTRRFANSTVWFSIEGNRAGVSTSGRCSWWNLRARAIVPVTVHRAKRVPRDGSSPSLKKLLFKPCMCAYARACMKHGQGAWRWSVEQWWRLAYAKRPMHAVCVHSLQLNIKSYRDRKENGRSVCVHDNVAIRRMRVWVRKRQSVTQLIPIYQGFTYV